MRSFLSFSTNYFHRWKDGSCIEVGPIKFDKALAAPAATHTLHSNFDFDASSALLPAGTKSSTVTSSSNQEVDHLYTFYDDIRYIPELHEMAAATQSVVQSTINNMKKFLLRFRIFKHLWRTDKVRIRRPTSATDPSHVPDRRRCARNSLRRIHRWVHSMKKSISTRRIWMR